VATSTAGATGRGSDSSAPPPPVATTAAEEAAWLPAARRGDPQALSRFYSAYYPLVWSLCRRLLRSEADAEDALQTTFVRAFAALPGFRGEGSVKTWLYRIALNEAMTQLRKRAAGPGVTVPLDDERDGADNGAGSGFLAASPNSGAAIAENVTVRALLETMKPEYRTVLVLRFWEDLAYEEIAEVTGLSLSNVKMRLHRAKEEFRRLYEGTDEERGGGRRR
jgi:RNA polymerase sigma-70 factor (ECF subfamily)